ncbi:hypothetical protein G5V65_20155 [Rhodobacter sp. HX-7-19]|uniref:Uncharacterized protein n=1 Tax=Paragemmobacter kunshanensis TaxID=2583234 RepID=A0A6M1U0B1_9RHOB|nr:hypothetical protein [Rhodobacter kunshanensis]NGQ93207.1 hypothetical protein [Rhodobacter kunshanensis]
MTAEKGNEPRLDVLLKEHAITCSQIHEMVNYSDKMVSISLAGIGLAFTYGVKESSAVAIVALPFIALGLLAYFCSVFYSIAVLGGYRKCLEEEINKFTGLPALCWEKVTTKLLHNSIPAIGIVVVLGLLYLSLCAVAWGNVSTTAGEQVTRMIKLAYVGGGLFLSAASLSLRTAHQRSYEPTFPKWPAA